MPAKSPQISRDQEKKLRELGERLRTYRKNLKLSAVTTAEASGLSRVTLYRIEKGEASVAIGAYISVVFALGLSLDIFEKTQHVRPQRKISTDEIPKNIRIADYKQLKRLAWQLKSTKVISSQEALDLYERNWRHINIKALEEREKKLIQSLLAAFGRERLLV